MRRISQLSRRSSKLRIALASAAGAAIAVNVAGCALFHHGETPQQQFVEALGRGNSVQASYIWRNMTAQDRAKFERGEGISPQADPATIAAQIVQHQSEEDSQDSADDPSATVGIPVDDNATAK